MNNQIRIYKSAAGRIPFVEWLADMRDVVGRAKVKVRIRRAGLGNLGDHRSVGAGVVELKVDHGPGYRIYLGLYGRELIVLLCGGAKSTQEKDIARAREYWEDYLRRL